MVRYLNELDPSKGQIEWSSAKMWSMNSELDEN